MDPNSGKKNMFNKKSRKEGLKLLYQESFKRITISFYKYVNIPHPQKIRDQLYSEWRKLNVFGRTYISSEGVNAQISVPEKNWKEFQKKLRSYDSFSDILFKQAIEDNGKSFFKLTIKVRNKIVADGLKNGEYDVSNVGTHLNAKQWNKAISDGAVVVDMRNHYESEIGRFKGAICPDVETFKEELPHVKNILEDKKDEQIILYCTGGIRCEKASAYLRHHGFKNVGQLHGGIIDYTRQLKSDATLKNNFEGRNFVFDERRGEQISNKVISKCHQCGQEYNQHVNCRNVNCNLLFLQCDSCKKKYQNCCSIECIDIVNMPIQKQKELRKGVENKKMYYSHKKVNLNLKSK